MVETMKAVVLEEFGSLRLRDIPKPRPQAATEVVVRVVAAGICQTDLETAEGGLVSAYGVPEFPYIPGHETTGIVDEVGSAVTAVTVGDRVALHPVSTCGLCSACRAGKDMYCPSRAFAGVDGRTAGGWAEYLCVDQRALMVVGADADLKSLCPLTDAGLTAYHAVQRAKPHLPAGGTVAVLGIGGVGLLGLQLLRQCVTGRIVVIEPSSDKHELARRLGADVVLAETGTVAVRLVDELTGGDGCGAVFDFVGAHDSADTAIAIAARGGTVSIVGAGGTLTIDTLSAVVAEITLLFNLVGSFSELEELLSSDGPALESPYVAYPIEDFERAITDFKQGSQIGRPILVP